MNVIVFHGSPRVKGNTEILLRECVRAVEEEGHVVTFFRPAAMELSPCANCGGCDKTGVCVIKDGMSEVYEAIRKGDRFIVGSPVFFFGLTAQLKALIDRCQAIWCEKYLLNRPIEAGPQGRKGLLITVGGMEREVGFTCCNATATAFFRTIGVPGHEHLSYRKVDAAGAIREHPTALKDVYEAAKKLLAS